MFNNFLPSKILASNNKLISILSIITVIIIFVGFVYSIFISPPDYIQGDSVRIMYVHVPASFIALSCYGLIGLISIFNLIFKIQFISLAGKSLAPIGLIFTIISMITGSLWGKPTWGIWWVWDARLTSMLILFFFYLSYITSWKFIKNFKTANKVTSFIAIVGLINLPIIKYSVDWWNTLHQSSSITFTKVPSIHFSMLVPLIIMLIGMLIFTLVIFLMRYKIEIIKFKLNKNNKS